MKTQVFDSPGAIDRNAPFIFASTRSPPPHVTLIENTSPDLPDDFVFALRLDGPCAGSAAGAKIKGAFLSIAPGESKTCVFADAKAP